MSNQFEHAFQQALSEDVNIKDCKECKFFILENKKPVCKFDSTNHEECNLVVKALKLSP